ncbi:hypothetical protein PANT_7d00015 [Moesziomyces antarcticus T-34]|uniref:Uncharacterized protein n=1 Tax=Pseudozyma antarctica (strain T-34) TaxID=1151754 RepID=M9LTT3_PSEA3|nr:hypothetical protein PANT_7d00015 [Moesziomyces antarcticus T-34]
MRFLLALLFIYIAGVASLPIPAEPAAELVHTLADLGEGETARLTQLLNEHLPSYVHAPPPTPLPPPRLRFPPTRVTEPGASAPPNSPRLSG